MGLVRVKILDVSGSRSSEVETPDDVAVNRILLLLVERMNLPLHSPDGQIMSYRLHHRRTGQQLLDNQTFAQSGVQAGDELRLQPEITAGKHTDTVGRAPSVALQKLCVMFTSAATACEPGTRNSKPGTSSA